MKSQCKLYATQVIFINCNFGGGVGVAGFNSHFREDRPREKLAEDHLEREGCIPKYIYMASVRILACWNCEYPFAPWFWCAAGSFCTANSTPGKYYMLYFMFSPSICLPTK